eukprot:gene4537-20789_t
MSLYPGPNRNPSILSEETLSQTHAAKLKNVMLDNTYKMEPDRNSVFRAITVRQAVESILSEMVGDQKYSAKESPLLCVELATEIKNKVKAMGFERYKLICQVTICSLVGQGVRVASRCIWDDKHDSYVSCNYRNANMCVVAMMYGVYHE